MSRPLRAATHARHYDAPSQMTDTDGTRHWITRAANFVVVVSDAQKGASLERHSNPDEYLLLLPPAMKASVAAADQSSQPMATASRSSLPARAGRSHDGRHGRAGLHQQGSGYPGEGRQYRSLCGRCGRSRPPHTLARSSWRISYPSLSVDRLFQPRSKPTQDAALSDHQSHDQRLHALVEAPRRKQAEPAFARRLRTDFARDARVLHAPFALSLVAGQDHVARRRT